MAIPPKNPSALMRSLGADESALDAKLRVSAKEAEQRWPLFRAMAPSKVEIPAAMTAAEKQAWEPVAAARPTARKPLIARPGISNKLADGLARFASTPKKAPSAKARAPEPPNVANETRSPSPKPVAVQSEPEHAAPREKKARDSGLFGATTPQQPPREGFLGQPSPPLSTHSALSTPARAAGGLLAEATSHPAQTRPKAKRVDSQPDTPKAGDDSLSAIFDRVEGKAAKEEQPRSDKAINSVLRRIGKR